MPTKRKQRILMLYDFPIMGGGSGTYVKYLAFKLHDTKQYEIAIALPDKEEVEGIKTFLLKLPQVPVFIGRPGLEKSKKYSDLTVKEITELYQAYLKETVKIIEEWRPDVIHVHHMLINSWVAHFIRNTYGIKYIVTSHGSCLHAISQDRRYFRQTREALRSAEVITAVSGDTREKLLDMFGHDLAKKTRTIPGGILQGHFPDKIADKELFDLRKRLNISSNKVALFTGRLITEKGVEYLIKAASKIKGDVVIAGDGPQKKKLEQMIKDRKLNNVHLLGHFDYHTLINLYYLADVFVAPAVWDEPLGLTIIEAMASKTPVVVTRRGGVTMAVKDGQTGLFVRSRNASDIAEKVNRLFLNEAFAKRMGEKARAVVLNKFTWKQIAHRFELVFAKI